MNKTNRNEACCSHKRYPSNSVAVGAPAKVIESIDDYSKKVKDSVVMTKGMSGEEKQKYLEKRF